MQEYSFSPCVIEFDSGEREARVRCRGVFIWPTMVKAFPRDPRVMADAEQREIRSVVIEFPIERTREQPEDEFAVDEQHPVWNVVETAVSDDPQPASGRRKHHRHSGL